MDNKENITENIYDILSLTYDGVEEIIENEYYAVTQNGIKKLYSVSDKRVIIDDEIAHTEDMNICTVNTAKQTYILFSGYEPLVIEGKYRVAFTRANLCTFVSKRKFSNKTGLCVVDIVEHKLVWADSCMQVGVSPKQDAIYYNTWNDGNGSRLVYIMLDGTVKTFEEYMDMQ